MRTLISLTLLSLVSCSKDITGTYKHKICELGPNCFSINLLKDSSYIFTYQQHLIGSGSISGKYRILKDTLFLTSSSDSIAVSSILYSEIIHWKEREYLIKGDKLFPLQREAEMSLLGNKTYLVKIK